MQPGVDVPNARRPWLWLRLAPKLRRVPPLVEEVLRHAARERSKRRIRRVGRWDVKGDGDVRLARRDEPQNATDTSERLKAQTLWELGCK